MASIGATVWSAFPQRGALWSPDTLQRSLALRRLHLIQTIRRRYPTIAALAQQALSTSPERALAALMLRHRRVADRARLGASLEVTTINLGLLDVAGSRVPLLNARRLRIQAELSAFIQSHHPAVVMVQECFGRADRQLVRDVAEDHGYRAVGRQPRLWRRTGLLLLLRSDAASNVVDSGYTRLPGDVFRVAGFARGVQWARVSLARGAEIVLANVHLSPMAKRSMSWRRSLQVAALVEALHRPGSVLCPAPDVPVVLGGDFNLAPHYTWRWTPKAPHVAKARRALVARWLDWDRTLFSLLASAMDSEAEVVAPSLYTLDARNPLWARYPLAQGEPSSRVDLVFCRGAAVSHAQLAFHQPPVGAPPLSDHYGLTATIGV